MQARVSVDCAGELGTISPNIYGSFAEHLGRCIYGGIWVGPKSTIPNEEGIRTDVAGALRELELPVLRWPGGCFADNYHWEWGVGPAEQRRPRHNLWWSQPESNEFGTDEFVQLCGMVGCEPYVCLNVGSGTVEEALGWVEYCNSAQDTQYTRIRRGNGRQEPYGVRYWGVGNENYGCGGSMTPEQYAWEYRKYATYLRRMDDTIEGGLYLVACGHRDGWNVRFLREMRSAPHLVNALSIHLYVGGYSTSATGFSDDQYYRLMGDVGDMEGAVRRATYALRDVVPGRPPGLVVDEWGTWYPEANVPSGLYQQSALRDAIYTACALNMFNRHCSSVVMTNMAQTVNVLQSVILTQGSQMVRTPTYWAYYLFRPHMGGTALACEVACDEVTDTQGRRVPLVSASASRAADGGSLVLTLVNTAIGESAAVEVATDGGCVGQGGEGLLLTAEDVRAHNTFDEPDRVKPEAFGAEARDGGLRLTLPPASLVALRASLT